MDLVAIGAHPDDVELFAGGLVAKCVEHGHEVGVIHLTPGERGTRGSSQERRQEALNAAKVLGIEPDRVVFLDLGDTLLENTEPNRLAIIEVLRRWRPRLVLQPHPFDRHPDHRKASRLCEDAFFYSHLTRVGEGQPPHRPEGRLMYLNNSVPDVSPSFIVDITEFFDRKMEAIGAYRSQFFNPDYGAEETYISAHEFHEQIQVRARYFGGLIGVRYGEPFVLPVPLAVDNPVALLLSRLPGRP